MNSTGNILLKTLVRRYYRQNAGLFLFLFLLFFGVVNPSELLFYHYALIRGILSVPAILAGVMTVWLLYAFKCARWVIDTLERPENLFLATYNALPAGRLRRLLFGACGLLFLPVLLYGTAITGVAVHEKSWLVVLLVPSYLLMLCSVCAWVGYKKLVWQGQSGDMLQRVLRSGRELINNRRMLINKNTVMLLKVFVGRFYRQYAAQLIFLFILFIGAVGELEGRPSYTGPVRQFHYQYALILGMLSSKTLFVAVLVIWLIYGGKCLRFQVKALAGQELLFLTILAAMSRGRLFRKLLGIQFLLFLPVIFFVVAIMAVAIYTGRYAAAVIVPVYAGGLCIVLAARCQYRLTGFDPLPARLSGVFTTMRRWSREVVTGFIPDSWRRDRMAGLSYCRILLLNIWGNDKLLLTGLKLYTCGLLYGVGQVLPGDTREGAMLFFLFCIGLFGHGVLLYRLREMEEKRLLFYKGLPISLFHRFMQYCLFYLLLLLPELSTVLLCMPYAAGWRVIWEFLAPGYGVLLLMNSLLFIQHFKMLDFLRLMLLVFAFLYAFVMGGLLVIISILLPGVAALLFRRGYFRNWGA